jgi:hypothetical protein
LHPAPNRRSPVDLDQLHIAFGNMGERATEFFRLMSLGPPRVWSAQARQILLLRERYATDAIDLALGHAAAFGALEHAAVERILAARATPRTLDEYVAETTTQRIEATLGHARTAPRDLTEYDRLPLTRATRSLTQETSPWPSASTSPSPHHVPTDPATTTSSPLASDDTSTSSA